MNLSNLLFLVLVLKKSNAFTYQICSESDGSNCYDQFFNENSFQAEAINNFYHQHQNYKYIWIDQIDNYDTITINLDNFDESLSIYFREKSFYSSITIQTNVEKDTENYSCPSIVAYKLDLYIENINPKNDKTVFIYKELTYKTISSKDISKPLYLLDKNERYSFIYFDRLTSNPTYISTMNLITDLEDEMQESQTIILSPYLRHDYDNYYTTRFLVRLSIMVPSKVIYGDNQIRIEFSNSKILTLLTEAQDIIFNIYLSEQTTISCDESVNEFNLISTNIINEYFYEPDKIKIEGNWSNVKMIKTDDEYIGDGKILVGYSKSFEFDGTFTYSANNLPVTYFGSSTLILTENNLSFNFLGNFFPISNLTILLQNEIETNFFINGRAVSTKKSDFFGDSYIITESPLLTIIASTNEKIDIIGPASIYYMKIDNRNNKIESAMNFLKGGEIIIPFGVKNDIINKDGETIKQLKDVYTNYKSLNIEPSENDDSEIWGNYLISFLKNKISDLSYIINNIKNKIQEPMTINAIDNNFIKLNELNEITLIRTDIPFVSLYSDALNEQQNLLCLKDGVFNLSEWMVKLDLNFFRGFADDGIENDKLINIISSTFSDSSFLFNTMLTENGRCIGIQPTTIPKSNFELFAYTKNATYIKLLEKLDAVKVLTPSDLDITSKLINKNTKNLLIVILDDLQEGKSINLNGISRNSNVFIFGYKIELIDKIIDCIRKLKKLEPIEFAKYITQFASQHPNYRPNVSLTFTSIHSFFVALVNYVGTNIRCTSFWAIFSSFPNLEKNPNSISAQTIVTETLTYKSLSSLSFTDLVIFPISCDPLNLMTIKEISFSEKNWTLKLTEFFKEEGYMNDENKYFSISTDKVRGQLFLYSFDYGCNFAVPESISGQQLKGVSINYINMLAPKIKDIHGIITLEDNKNEIFPPLKLIKQVKTESNDHFTFTGNWDKVSLIDGEIEISTGDIKVTIEDVPAVVAESLDVKTEKNVQISFTKPQIISQQKTFKFQNKNIEVTFLSLIFKGEDPTLSLLIDGNSSKIVTNHISVETETNVQILSDIEVKESFEFGPESSIKGNLISSKNVKLNMNYRLRSKFGTIPDSIEPETIYLNYIGENENVNAETDYSIYLGALNDIQKFNGNDHKEKCENWKSKTSLKSDFFPEFRDDSKFIKTVCINKDSFSILAINLTSIPKGEVIIEDTNTMDPSNGIDDVSGNGEQDKKKMSIFAIIGIIIGCIVLIVIIIILIFKFKNINKSENENKSEDDVTKKKLTIIEKKDKTIENKDFKVNSQSDSEEADEESNMNFWI